MFTIEAEADFFRVLPASEFPDLGVDLGFCVPRREVLPTFFELEAPNFVGLVGIGIYGLFQY